MGFRQTSRYYLWLIIAIISTTLFSRNAIIRSFDINLALVYLNFALSDAKGDSEIREEFVIRARDSIRKHEIDENTDNNLHLILANALADLGNRDEAIIEIEKIPVDSVKNDEFLLGIGDFYWRSGQKSEAIAIWTKLDDPVQFLLEHCESLRASGHSDAALHYCLGATSIAPRHGWARYFLGRVYRSLGENVQAIIEIQTASDLEPTNIRYLLSLGDLLDELGQYDEARSLYERILDIDEQNQEAIIRLKNYEIE